MSEPLGQDPKFLISREVLSEAARQELLKDWEYLDQLLTDSTGTFLLGAIGPSGLSRDHVIVRSTEKRGNRLTVGIARRLASLTWRIHERLDGYLEAKDPPRWTFEPLPISTDVDREQAKSE